MSGLAIGIDCDGVLADFNLGFIERVVKETHRDLFPPRPFDIPTWDYPQHYGYTREEISSVWMGIREDPQFWETLPEYPTTSDDLRYLNGRRLLGDDIYFITARPGLLAKKQTEAWLLRRWPMPYTPPITVLLSARKDLCAEALSLDLYVDDRDINVESVIATRNYDSKGSFVGERTRTFLFDRPWNRSMENMTGITRVNSLVGIVERIL